MILLTVVIQELVPLQQTFRSVILCLELVVAKGLINESLGDGVDLPGTDFLFLIVGITVQVAKLMSKDNVWYYRFIVISHTIGVLACRHGLDLVSESIPLPLLLDAPCHLLHSFIIHPISSLSNHFKPINFQ